MDFQLLGGAVMLLFATSLGAISALVVKRVKKRDCFLLIAFAAGVMAFSTIEMGWQSARRGNLLAAAVGGGIGVLALLAIERLLPHVHPHDVGPDGGGRKTTLVATAVAIHNIPEGLAVGTAFAVSPAVGWFVAASIALQDIPEGLLISAPLYFYGIRASKAIFLGILSGLSETVAAIAASFLLGRAALPIPAALAFSAGAMGYVLLVELLPDAFSKEGARGRAALSFASGFLIALALAKIIVF